MAAIGFFKDFNSNEEKAYLKVTIIIITEQITIDGYLTVFFGKYASQCAAKSKRRNPKTPTPNYDNFYQVNSNG